jgi:SAM-dependent methyltransferase
MLDPLVGSYLGVDLPENPAAEQHIDASGRTPLPDGYADVVWSTQVLEHVDSPAVYLEEAKRLLRPSGLLVLSTHGIWWHHPHPQDLWRWTGPGLVRLLSEHGFEVEPLRGVMNLASTGVNLAQDGLYGRLPKRGPLRPALFVAMQLLAAAADRVGVGGRDRMAAVFVAAARKPTTKEPAA